MGPLRTEEFLFWSLYRLRASEHDRVFPPISVNTNICFLALYSSWYTHLLTINFLISSGDGIMTPQVFSPCHLRGILIVTASAHSLPSGKLRSREFTGGFLEHLCFLTVRSLPSVSGHGVPFTDLLHFISWTRAHPSSLYSLW